MLSHNFSISIRHERSDFFFTKTWAVIQWERNQVALIRCVFPFSSCVFPMRWRVLGCATLHVSRFFVLFCWWMVKETRERRFFFQNTCAISIHCIVFYTRKFLFEENFLLFFFLSFERRENENGLSVADIKNLFYISCHL